MAALGASRLSRLQPLSNGNVVADPTIIGDAVTAEGDTLLVWGTFHRDALPMDGLIWAGVQDASGEKRAIVIHDRDLYWSNSADQPVDAQGQPASVPTYGPWQVLFNVQEAPGYVGQTGGGPVIWLNESLEPFLALWKWDGLISYSPTSNDMSQLGCSVSGLTMPADALLSAHRFPDNETAANNSVNLSGWLVGILSGCGDWPQCHQVIGQSQMLFVCPDMEEACEEGETETQCWHGMCTCSAAGGFICNYGECYDDDNPLQYQPAY